MIKKQYYKLNISNVLKANCKKTKANKLWIENKKAEINACNIEHLLDDEIIEKLQKYV